MTNNWYIKKEWRVELKDGWFGTKGSRNIVRNTNVVILHVQSSHCPYLKIQLNSPYNSTKTSSKLIYKILIKYHLKHISYVKS